MSLFDKKKIVGNASGMAVATLVQAGIKIFSIPLLLSIYGKHNFGLLSLALSINAYLQFLSFGIPGSLVKFVSASSDDSGRLAKICRSSNSFFFGIGGISFCVFMLFAQYGCRMFGLPPEETQTIRLLFMVSAFSTLIYWPGSYLDSLMTAREDLVILSSFQTLKALFEIIGVILLYNGYLDWSLVQFFIFQCLCMHCFLPIKIWRIIRLRYPVRVLLPSWDWKVFKPVLHFSAALLVVQVVASTANNLQPVLLAVRCNDATSVVADFRIMFTIANLALLGASFLRTSLFPSISKAYANGHHREANEMIYTAARYGWAILALPLFAGIALVPEMLRLYVGETYLYLSRPLQIWLLALSVQLYNGPGFAAVMGGGSMKLFAFSMIVSCMFSLSLLWVVAPQVGVAAAVLSTLSFNLVHMIFLHALILKKIPGLDSVRLLLRCYLPPLLSGLVAGFVASGVGHCFIEELWGRIFSELVIVSVAYVAVLCLFFDESDWKKLRPLFMGGGD